VTRVVKVSFFIKTEEDSGDLLIGSPLNGSTYYVSGRTPLVLTASAPLGADSVEYVLDGTTVGSATKAPYAVVTELDPAVAGWGEHHVTATAQALGSVETVSTEVTFTLAPAAPEDDINGNGLPDNPFARLSLEGDTWVRTVTTLETGGTLVAGVTRFEGAEENDITADAPIVTVLQGSNDGKSVMSVSVPRALLNADETGMVVVAVADDLETLVGFDQAALLLPEPDGHVLAPGGKYVQVSVLTTKDGGVTFDEVEDARVANHPVHVEIQGLELAQDPSLALYKHPMFVESDSLTGIAVVADEGEWTASDVANLKVESSSASADLMSLSVLAIYETPSGEQSANTGCAGGSLDSTFRGSLNGDGLFIALAVTALLFAGRRKSVARGGMARDH
jgi:hypothetical protein